MQTINMDQRAECPNNKPGWFKPTPAQCPQPIKITGQHPCGHEADSAGCDGFGLQAIYANLIPGDPYPFTASSQAPRPTHSSGLFIQTFGSVAARCKVDGKPCASTDECRKRSQSGSDFCNTRAAQALHIEPHGATNGIFVDGGVTKGSGVRVDAPLCDPTTPSCNGEVFLNQGALHASRTRFILDDVSRTSLRAALDITSTSSATAEQTPDQAKAKARTVFVTHNGEIIPIFSDTEHIYLHGNGAKRSGVQLANGHHAGQQLFLFGYTWSVTLSPSSANIDFSAKGAPTFGHGKGDVMSMQLHWVVPAGVAGKWFEVSRAIR